MSCERPLARHAWLLAALTLVLLKLWLVAGQTIQALGNAQHDDALFLRLAESLLLGEWLGAYNELTLCKGPMYSFFIAGVHWTGLPLFGAQQLFYCLACAVFTWAVRPWLGPPWAAFGLFVVLLFHPITYETVVHSRVLRQDILPALVLFALAGLLALAERPSSGRSARWGWAGLAGGSMGAVWLTREETIWFVPLWLGLWLWLAVSAWPALRARQGNAFLELVLPLLVWALLAGGVAALNQRVYGVFTTCEFRSGPFGEAYGALTRVQPPERYARVPVTRAAREMIYAVSPAFAELRPHFEGDLGRDWAGGPSAESTGFPAERREIGGGWFMWALRDAVTRAGHGRSATDVAAYFSRLASEVNEACDRGQLPAQARRKGFIPPLSAPDLWFVRDRLLEAAGHFFTLREMHVRSCPSVGSPAELQLFSDLTRGRLSPVAGGPPFSRAQRKLDHFRVKVLEHIAQIYQGLIVPVGVVAFLAWTLLTSRQLARRQLPLWLVYHAGLFVSMLALFAIHALITVTSFPSIHPGSFSALYPIWSVFAVTVWMQAQGEKALPTVEPAVQT